MKKETIEIKAAYVAPEIRVHEVRAQQSFMSYGDPGAPGDDLDRGDSWDFGNDD